MTGYTYKNVKIIGERLSSLQRSILNGCLTTGSVKGDCNKQAPLVASSEPPEAKNDRTPNFRFGEKRKRLPAAFHFPAFSDYFSVTCTSFSRSLFFSVSVSTPSLSFSFSVSVSTPLSLSLSLLIHPTQIFSIFLLPHCVSFLFQAFYLSLFYTIFYFC